MLYTSPPFSFGTKGYRPYSISSQIMFSKFRVSKRSAVSENEETPGLVLVSTSRISQNSKKYLPPLVFPHTGRTCRHRVGRPIHDQKCAGCVKDRQSVINWNIHYVN